MAPNADNSQAENRTAWEVVRDTYEVVRTRYRARPTAPSLAPLLDLSALRALNYAPESTRRSDFSLPGGASPANRNLKAALQQVVGVKVPATQTCQRCANGSKIWDVCVVGPGRTYCANCAYNGQERKCSLAEPSSPSNRNINTMPVAATPSTPATPVTFTSPVAPLAPAVSSSRSTPSRSTPSRSTPSRSTVISPVANGPSPGRGQAVSRLALMTSAQRAEHAAQLQQQLVLVRQVQQLCGDPLSPPDDGGPPDASSSRPQPPPVKRRRS